MPISQEIIATIAALNLAFTSLELAEKSLTDDDILHLMPLIAKEQIHKA